ncbi:MAG: hypothetical protein MZW92_02130 [Comamonadaceae bacterium]|nr:hypothetical protein [Comamonadaceae bacterium]
MVGIDKATRTVTLKGPKGKVVDVVAGDEVKNFDQIKVGDCRRRALRRGAHARAEEDQGRCRRRRRCARRRRRRKPGEKPAVAGARQVTAIADVTAVDPKKSTITLKGPQGKVVTLDVQNPDQFKVVKKGDQVEVTYTEALALSVEAAPKPAAAKKP